MSRAKRSGFMELFSFLPLTQPAAFVPIFALLFGHATIQQDLFEVLRVMALDGVVDGIGKEFRVDGDAAEETAGRKQGRSLLQHPARRIMGSMAVNLVHELGEGLFDAF